MNCIRHALALLSACFLMSAFAQEQPESPAPSGPKKVAVYVFGAGEAGINKSFGNKLLAAITQSDKYAEIEDSEAFYKELAKSNEDGIAQITQTAKQYGADYVCVVGMIEAFGAYSILARIIKTSDSQAIRTASLDRSLRSLDDLTRVSNELVSQLFRSQTQAPAPYAVPVPAVAPAMAVTAKKECTDKLNINEIISKIQSGFLAQLKDCSATLVKNMALAASPFGKKTAQPEPVVFMKECTIEGIRQKLPGGADEYIKPIEKFLQNVMNAASAAGGGLDVKKLSGAISGLNVNDLINELKTKAANDECIVDEPYTPVADDEDDEDDSDGEGGRKIVSLGFRVGLNLSHLYTTFSGGYSYSGSYSGGMPTGEGSYNPTLGFQAGLVLDIAPSSWFHIQPGVMYIQKGAKDNEGTVATSHNVEFPLLLSLKFSALRLNAGPYFGICLDAPDYIGYGDFDIGISTGFGFDIGMFYVGMFYEYGFDRTEKSVNGGGPGYSYSGYRNYSNRTFGFNFGVNL